MKTEDRARQNADRRLEVAGRNVQDHKALCLCAGLAVLKQMRTRDG